MTHPNYNLPTVGIDGYDVPVLDHIDARIVREIDRGGVLDMRAFHTCDTIHCVAGWAVHLCGDQGYRLAFDLEYYDDVLRGDHIAGEFLYRAAGAEPPSFDGGCGLRENHPDYSEAIGNWSAYCLKKLRERAALDPLPEESEVTT